MNMKEEIKNIVKNKDIKSLYKIIGALEITINRYEKLAQSQEEKEAVEGFLYFKDILEVIIEAYENCLKEKNMI